MLGAHIDPVTRPVMTIVIIALLCAAPSPRADAQDVPTAPQRMTPVVGDPAFNPLPEMWGLQVLRGDTRLGAIDETFVLYADRRARFEGGASSGRVYLAEGEQLIVDESFDESGYVGVQALCLCALEYEAGAAMEQIQIAAGALPARGRPAITTPRRGVTRIAIALDGGGRSAPARLVCWSAADDTVAALTTALPGFLKLTRKTQPNFENPPVDDRPIGTGTSDAQSGGGQPLTLTEDTLGVDGLPTFEVQPQDAPQTRGPAKPGLLTWLRELRTGERAEIDNEDYFYFADDPSLQRLDRDSGIYFRTGGYWP